MKSFSSWGNYPPTTQEAEIPRWWSDVNLSRPFLPYGMGRSYGDSCLSSSEFVICTRNLNRFLAFDKRNGILKCDSGVSFDEILKLTVPHGWFLPVTPGTKYITVGGAIANDVHGKDHHVRGTFGRYVKSFELLRSDGSQKICSATQNSDWFKATIGGLGLTGIITWAEFQLLPIKSSSIEVESIKFSHVYDFFSIASESDKNFQYTVAWIDCLATGKKLGRGIFMRGNHMTTMDNLDVHREPKLTLPVAFPNVALNSLSMNLFNFAYYNRQRASRKTKIAHYDSFFYPLDAVNRWNNIYGKRGFFQYQFVVPFVAGKKVLSQIFEKIAQSQQASFLAVLKNFGALESPGLLSFPRPGITLALDFPNRGEKTLQLFAELDELVAGCGGALYPAKDARMEAAHFKAAYPRWAQLEELRDPMINSKFWQRVVSST